MKPTATDARERLPSGRGKRIAIVSAQFYRSLADELEDGARRALADCGVTEEAVSVAHVPGCFELPLAAQRAAARDVDAIVALGVVVRGETPHFDYVAGECARGLMDVQLKTGVPVGFGVLTTDTLAQAETRAARDGGDKGYFAALAALAVLEVP